MGMGTMFRLLSERANYIKVLMKIKIDLVYFCHFLYRLFIILEIYLGPNKIPNNGHIDVLSDTIATSCKLKVQHS
jgi:hypothetical protein